MADKQHPHLTTKSIGAEGSRTRVFTSTWPPFAFDRTGAGESRTGPFCQVTIRKVQSRENEGAMSSEGAPSTVSPHPGGDEADVRGDAGASSVVFADPSLLMRSYNSVSLSESGRYTLALSDCHGFMSSASTTILGSEMFSDGEKEVEPARLLFLPVPLSIAFEADVQVSIGGGVVIGNFHLLPIAHVPTPPTPPAPPPSLDTNPARIADRPRPATSLHPFVKENYAIEPRDGCVQTSGGSPTSGLGFITGAFAGVVACQLVWLLVSRGRGRAAWERYMARFGRGKRSGKAWEKRRHRRGKGLPRSLDDREASEGESTDSDGILNGHVPDPVGLPRSEEDWRAWFDTLYEDGKDQAAEANIQVPANPGPAPGENAPLGAEHPTA